MGDGAQEKGLAGVGDMEHGVPCKACGERGWGSLKTGGCENPSKWILLRRGGIPVKLENSLLKAGGEGVSCLVRKRVPPKRYGVRISYVGYRE